MKNRFTVASAATLALLTTGVCDAAHSEDAFASSVHMDGFAFCAAGPSPEGCQRFQGYIYAGPRPAGAAVPAADPSLGDERLYIHLGGADAR